MKDGLIFGYKGVWKEYLECCSAGSRRLISQQIRLEALKDVVV